MEIKAIMATKDPNELRARIDQIDRELGSLHRERALVDHCFQQLLARNAQKPTAIPVRQDEVRVRTGFEDSNPLNNRESANV
jgi:chorismate mutase